MFVYFILWVLSNARSQESNLAALKEVVLNYKDLIAGYKTKWTFDDLEMKSKAQRKFSFETYYSSGDPEKINNIMGFWALISWLILIFILDILTWNVLPRLVNPILAGFKIAPFTSEAIGAIAFLVPIGYMLWLGYIKPALSRKKEVNTRATMMAKDLFDIEFAIQRNNDATLVSRTAAELRVSERNKDLLNKAGVQITGDVVNGDVVHGDKVNGNVIINRNKTDK
jgi:hypothetical protein